MVVGETKQIHATVLPDNADNKTVTYSTDSKTVATVSQSGLITAVGPGQANITVVSQGNTSLTRTIAVNVLTNIVDVSSIQLTEQSYNILVDGTCDIGYTVLPENATDKSVTFQVKSGDESVASVTAVGHVTGLSAGTATIYVISNQKGSVFASVTINVSNAHTPVTSISMNETSVSLEPGAQYQIHATALPEDATNKALQYISSDTNVATVSESGLVTIVGNDGDSVAITIRSVDDPTVSRVLTINVSVVIVPVSSVTLNGDKTNNINISNVAPINLSATVLPENASDKSLKWSSDNTSVASVDQNGVVTPKGVAGQAIITVESVFDSTKKDTYTLTVDEVLVQSIVLQEAGVAKSELEFTHPDIAAVNTKTLTAVVSPDNANDKSIAWSSTNPSVATVANGVVTPKGLGDSVITATNIRSGVYKTILVHVRSIDVTEVKVYLESQEISSLERTSDDLGSTIQLIAGVLPENATNKTVSWSSLNTSIATVSAGGLVTLVGCGTTSIRATSEDNPSIYKDVTLTVGEIMVQTITIKEGVEEIESLEFATTDIGHPENARQLTADIYPANALDRDLSWNIEDASIASVSSTGLVTPLAEGSTRLFVTNTKSLVSASIKINVLQLSNYMVNLPVSKSSAFTTFEANSGVKANKWEEYFDRAQTYKVGNLNAANFMPKFQVVDLNNIHNTIPESYWAYDFDIEVFSEGDGSYSVAAPVSEYQILNKRTCEIKFDETAYGNKYKVKVSLGNKEAVMEDPSDLPETFVEYHEAKVSGAESVTCWGDGSPLREFLYVDDLANLCVQKLATLHLSFGSLD